MNIQVQNPTPIQQQNINPDVIEIRRKINEAREKIEQMKKEFLPLTQKN